MSTQNHVVVEAEIISCEDGGSDPWLLLSCAPHKDHVSLIYPPFATLFIVYLFSIPDIHQSGYRTSHSRNNRQSRVSLDNKIQIIIIIL